MLRQSPTLGLAAVALTAVVAALVAGGIAWKAFKGVREISLPPFETLSRARKEYLEVVKRTPPTIQRLNELLAQSAAAPDAKSLETFQRESREFKEWIALQQETWRSGKLIILEPVALTVDVGSLFRDLDAAFTAYLASAQSITAGDPQPVLLKTGQTTQQINDLVSQARARAAAIDVVVSVSSKWRLSYRTLVFTSLVIIVMVLIWFGTTVYRFSFIPLRTKLAESRAVIEKQQKLAHFGELAAGLAHEIRNPLTAINARLYTLKKSVHSFTPEAEDVAVIHAEINRLDRIVKDFLKLARPTEPNLTAVTASALFEEVADLLTPELQASSITLIQRDDLTPFQGDAQQLKQVLINLIQNAADAIGKDGTITLSARVGQKRLNEKTEDVMVLTVADTGHGITPEVQQRLFDPFYSTKEGGTGLGLPISARIVEKHGGVLEFETQLGRGTTFDIVLPLRTTADEAERPHN